MMELAIKTITADSRIGSHSALISVITVSCWVAGAPGVETGPIRPE